MANKRESSYLLLQFSRKYYFIVILSLVFQERKFTKFTRNQQIYKLA